MGCENKFKIGDRVRVLPRNKALPYSHHGAQAGEVFTVWDVRGENGDNLDTEVWAFYEHEVELAPTISADKFYRTRSGKPTGRVTVGDTGFEAVVDGKVRIFDAAGGAVHGGDDIVEEWTPKVGERVRFVRDGTAGGARFGRKGDTATVAGDVREGNSAVDVKVDGSSIGFNPGAYLSDLEPLPVAAPAQPTAPVSTQVDAIAEEYGPVVAASSPKFKVGDRVKAIKGTAILKVGEIYTVERVDGYKVYVSVDDYGILDYGQDYFYLVPTPQPEPDTTLHIKFSSDFSDLDAAILVRKKKLKKLIKLARKAGIELREAA